ncbi:winged helix-turn-helix transcriptional regulator [Halorientalis salina]|uniref:winged helix-turn-helix transcriptional regulator n=1 Tax=Halorientalis salina TaxID=2932266 RepID=UPI0010ABAE37|nr:winged helix-turn-helix transcriptional regulator [Halorientalis salina]
MTEFDSGRSTGTPESLLESASLLSKKWHPAIVRCLEDGDGLGFSDLEQRLDGISAKVLTDALEELQKYDIIARKEVSQRPLRVEYTLTDRGTDLETVIESLADWGETYLEDDQTETVVLIADDDRRISAMHTTWLDDEYTVRTAHDGEETLRELDTDVDVLVLDRRMPGLSGDEVLDWLRSQRYDARVVMVTSEDPDLDLLDMEFDEYLTKPVVKDDLRAVVADLVERSEYDDQLQQYLALRSKLAVLQAETPIEDLESREEYERLLNRLDALDATSDDIADAAPETLDRISLPEPQ